METVVLALLGLLIMCWHYVCVCVCEELIAEVCVLQMAAEWWGLTFITITTDLGLFLLLQGNETSPPLLLPATAPHTAQQHGDVRPILRLIQTPNIAIFTRRNVGCDVLSLLSVPTGLCWTVEASGATSPRWISQEAFPSQVIEVNNINTSGTCQWLHRCGVYNLNLSQKSSTLSPLLH